MSLEPLCYVIISSGTAPLLPVIESVVRKVGMIPIMRQPVAPGSTPRAFFDQQILCSHLIADITGADPNLFYEIGVRNGLRPGTSLLLRDSRTEPSCDTSFSPAITFDPEQTDDFEEQFSERLKHLLDANRSPDGCALFRLVEDVGPGEIQRLKTDVFRDAIDDGNVIKARLKNARDYRLPDEVTPPSERDPSESERWRDREQKQRQTEMLRALEDALEPEEKTAGLIVDLFLSYRAIENYDAMIDLYERMPIPLRQTRMIREQLGFALNRRGDRDRALEVLEGVARQFGPSSETHSLIGRVYKDLWTAACAEDHGVDASVFLDKAIENYLIGFASDWRDAFPGINAVTLLEIRGDPASLAQKDDLIPVVRFAVRQRLGEDTVDYWDHATLLQLAVLADDEEAARGHLRDALALVREAWEPKSTADNFGLIRRARAARGRVAPWLDDVIRELEMTRPDARANGRSRARSEFP